MAGERKGIAYEALVKLALEDLKKATNPRGKIFWNESPDGETVEPHLPLEPGPDGPAVLLLVTHSGPARDSHKKSWRHLGELVKGKTRLNSTARSASSPFSGRITTFRSTR